MKTIAGTSKSNTVHTATCRPGERHMKFDLLLMWTRPGQIRSDYNMRIRFHVAINDQHYDELIQTGLK